MKLVEVIKLNQKNSEKVLKRTVKEIKKGKILVCPTDTVYGLICDGTCQEAVRKLFKIKKRSRKKPIPIFVRDIKMAKRLARIDKKQEEFLKKVWPGAVTVVLKKRNRGTIGIRIPDYKFVLRLVKDLNRPLAETSANISGSSAPVRIKEILKQFENQKYQPDLIIDAGKLKGKPSAVIDLTGKKIKILRKGKLTKKLVENFDF